MKREIFTYESKETVFSVAWSNHRQTSGRLAVGSFVEDYANTVMVVELDEGSFREVGAFEHPYPPTRVAFAPEHGPENVLATSGDYLRLWQVGKGEVTLKATLNQNKSSEFCAPLTSFDWNEWVPSMVGTCSIDTTCTIWDIEKQVPLTQLIAHDKEVFDMAFQGPDKFASVGADGSLRMFDLRSLEHSTIIYETPHAQPLLRVCWNRQDRNYLATICMETPETIVIDIRRPSVPAAILSGHSASVSAVCWAPHSSSHLVTAGDDRRTLIWDLSPLPKKITDPILSYKAEAEINNLSWSVASPDWIAIAYQNKLQVLRV